jgi:hypothetical protein
MFMKIEDDLTIPHSLNPVANDLSVSPLKTTEVTEISPLKTAEVTETLTTSNVN